jgi:excisionase family DNA binding protein
MNAPLVPDALSIPDACEMASVGRSTIYAAITEGRLKARKLGRRTLILRDDLAHFLAALPQASAGPGALASRPENLKTPAFTPRKQRPVVNSET